MPNIPSVGVFVPNGYLNAGSFAGPSGQQDAYGNNYPSGLTPGKMIMLGTAEAQGLALPGTNLYDGTYQCVLLDSGATASLATVGYAAYIKLDSGATQGALPQTEYDNLSVTTGDQAGSTDLKFFAGIFINPATYDGVSAAPIPGQYCFIFTGAGQGGHEVHRHRCHRQPGCSFWRGRRRIHTTGRCGHDLSGRRRDAGRHRGRIERSLSVARHHLSCRQPGRLRGGDCGTGAR